MLRCSAPLITLVLLVGIGCTPKLPNLDSELSPRVQISEVVQRNIIDSVRFTGRFNAINYVNVKARVTGYLETTPFKEGDFVKKGDLLFKIDQRPYQAKYNDVNAQVKLFQAKLKLAKADNLRAQDVGKTPGAISKQELDKYQAAEEEALASVDASKASLEIQKINLDFCSVLSPIDGRISKYYITMGNIVNQDNTDLTTIVSENPMYCYFDIDERTLIKLIRTIQAEKPPENNKGSRTYPVFIGLADEKDFPHQATLNFTNNQIDSQTGSLTLRAVIPNKIKDNKTPLFIQGMFCKVRLPTSKPKDAILVSDRAIGTDQGLKFVYVVNSENKLEYRRVTLGELQEDNLRAINDGLKLGEKVVVAGIHMVKSGMTVIPEVVQMPTVQMMNSQTSEQTPSK